MCIWCVHPPRELNRNNLYNNQDNNNNINELHDANHNEDNHAPEKELQTNIK